MKTGSTEIQHKLTVHLETTLKCYPNYLIFSDLAEEFQGEEVIDALDEVDSKYHRYLGDFELYRRLQQHGRQSLHPSELSGPVSRPQGASGKPGNRGWILDKWKFLPMMRKTLDRYPDKKWYIFVETDTFIFWRTLLAYLDALDETKPYYLGGQNGIDGFAFAHGGTGILVSRPALQKAVKQYVDHKAYWEDFTNRNPAGDLVLGKAFAEVGVPLTYAWPIFQSDDVGDMDYERVAEAHRLWCHPTVSYHHLSPSVVKELWQFEQEWLSKQGKHSTAVLRHKDIFADYVLPRIARPRDDWNNHCRDDMGPVESFSDCHSICETDHACLQFAIDPDFRCFTSSKPNLGERARGYDAGWMYDRMKAFHDHAKPCGDEGWLL